MTSKGLWVFGALNRAESSEHREYNDILYVWKLSVCTPFRYKKINVKNKSITLVRHRRKDSCIRLLLRGDRHRHAQATFRRDFAGPATVPRVRVVRKDIDLVELVSSTVMARAVQSIL